MPFKRVKTTEERFHESYFKTSCGCWIWLGVAKHNGYGQIKVYKKYIRAHRLAYELFNGKIPLGSLICHTCDIPSCVNPEHLWLGTHVENALDMVKKGR